mmetsp:Transcript_5071/g.18453  ORF Transcript_5071/g.18453 Transcript_5071/m.18453 type:complete len:265 (+) Transcript_5071:248-1042(+)
MTSAAIKFECEPQWLDDAELQRPLKRKLNEVESEEELLLGHPQQQREPACQLGRDAAARKATREKARRDRLNSRFMDLATLCALPGQKPATDKMTVVSEAVRKIESLQQQGQQLREEVADLKHIVNDLRMEKNELREELREERMMLRTRLKQMQELGAAVPPPLESQTQEPHMPTQLQPHEHHHQPQQRGPSQAHAQFHSKVGDQLDPPGMEAAGKEGLVCNQGLNSGNTAYRVGSPMGDLVINWAPYLTPDPIADALFHPPCA